MKVQRHHRPAPYLPFISLADIAWQIIIFFLLAATFVSSSALTVPLPSAAAQPAGTMKTTIAIDASEAVIKVNGRPTDLDSLQSQIAGLLVNATTDEQKAVIVRATDDLTFQRNADILYAVEQAGGIVVMPEEHRGEDQSQKE